jgi:putative ABC transport system permease protein
MRPRWQKVAADLVSHRARSLLVILSIAVGLFAIGQTTVVYAILSRDMRAGYRAIQPANILVQASSFDQDFVTHISHLPGVAEAQGARDVSLQVRTPSGTWKPISIKALTDRDIHEQSLNRVELLEGVWPPEHRQIALDRSKMADTGASLGDELEIRLPSGTIRRLRLIGIVRDQTIGAGRAEGGFFLASIQGYVTMDALARLEQPKSFNTLYVTVEQGQEDRAAIRIVADRVLDEFDQYGITVTGSIRRASGEHPNVAYVDAIISVVYLLAVLVMFLSGFLITNTLSALLSQQVQQIGVMKTLGGTRKQIIGVYMVLVLVFSLIALAISVPLSQRTAYALLRYLAAEINFNLQGTRPVPAAVLLQVVVALVVPQLAGSFPIWRGTRISVREALSGGTPATVASAGFVYRMLAKVRRLSRPLLISLRNTFRQRARLALTLTTLALGGAIFVATFNVRYSLDNTIDRLGRYFLADVNLMFSRPYPMKRVERDVLQVPGVESVEGWTGAVAQVIEADGTPGESVRVVAPPADSPLVEPVLLRGRWIEPGDQNAVALSELFLEVIPGLEVGDTARLRIGMEERDWVVVGFFQFAGRSGGLFAYVNRDYLARKTGMVGRSVSYRLVGSGRDLSLAEQEALGRQVEAYLTARGYDISEVTAGRSLHEKVSRGLNVLTTTLLILSLLLAAVGSIGLTGTMGLNVMERTREIGVMRAIGGSDRAIMKIVLIEGSLIGLISWLLACIAAVPISKILADRIFQIVYDRPAEIVFAVSGSMIWLGVVALLSVLASAAPAYSASRLTIREVLAYE